LGGDFCVEVFWRIFYYGKLQHADTTSAQYGKAVGNTARERSGCDQEKGSLTFSPPVLPLEHGHQKYERGSSLRFQKSNNNFFLTNSKNPS
jgi:hypothetical protein